MSERSSFITEYIHCKKCLEKLKSVLLLKDKYLTGVQIPTWLNDDCHLPIIAGKIGSMGPSGEFITLMELFDEDNAPCHPVRIAILHDFGKSCVYMITPDGWVTELGCVSKDILEDFIKKEKD